MDKGSVRSILNDVAEGRISPDDAMLKLRLEPFEDLGFAKVDLHREMRQGVPEVIFGQGKTAGQIAEIAGVMNGRGVPGVMVTRLDPDKALELSELVEISYDSTSRIGLIGKRTEES